MNILQIFFPALMVVGAFGSFVLNIHGKGDVAVTIQWFGATFLYIGLTLRNMG